MAGVGIRSLTHLVQINFDMAKSYIESGQSDGMTPAVYLVEEGDGTVSIHSIAFGDARESKENSITLMRFYCLWKKAVRVSFLSESWMLQLPPGSSREDVPDSIADHPDAKSILFAIGESLEGEPPVHLQGEITEDRKIPRAEFISLNGDVESRFTGILPPSKETWTGEAGRVAEFMYTVLRDAIDGTGESDKFGNGGILAYSAAILESWRGLGEDQRPPGEPLN